MSAASPLLVARRFSLREYEQMVEAGILGKDDRVELLDGEIVEMSPIGPSHQEIVDNLNELLVGRLAGRMRVRIQGPLNLPPRSQPEPDVMVYRRPTDRVRHPEAPEALLVVEVADTTLARDRTIKRPLYARSGVTEMWIVDVGSRRIEVYRDPADGTYTVAETYGEGDTITIAALPDVRLPVAEILAAPEA